MTHNKDSLMLSDGSPVVTSEDPHNCYFQSGWNKPYSHTTVAVILSNAAGEIAFVKRRPDEPAEGGKLALPGGYVELGQKLADAAKIEVQEETGHLIIHKTLGRFAIMDGPTTLPGRTNEHDLNIVHVFTAQAANKVQEHDDEVTGVLWVRQDDLPPREQVAFGHYDIVGMWIRHQEQPFDALPIMPSEMRREELFLPLWELS